MSFLQTSFFSETLKMTTSMNVILPQRTSYTPQAVPPHQTLFLLHGLSDDHTGWARFSSVERHAQKYNLAVIMPTTARGFYTDMLHGPNWWSFVSQELPDVCRSMFRLSDRREDTFAAGLSMGGYGAVKLGLLRPDLVSHVVSLSGALLTQRFVDAIRDDPDRNPLAGESDYLFGESLRPGDDIFALLEREHEAARDVSFDVYCGEADDLFALSDAFQARAAALGLRVGWTSEPKAAHTWDYWDRCLPAALRRLPLRPAMKLI